MTNNMSVHIHTHQMQYDNEWGYSMRMADLARKVAKDYLGA
jgi:glyceraldehyde-3-phosphate dehydrogenase/erythrose-4-phosphate dehydrogenase